MSRPARKPARGTPSTPATGKPSQIWNGLAALDGIHGPSGNALALGNGLAAR